MHAARIAGVLERDGWVVVPRAVAPDRLGELLELLGSRDLPDNGVLALDAEHDPVAVGLGCDPVLRALATAALLGPVDAFGVSYLVKPPFSSLPVLWHQDGYPWSAQLGIESAVTAWVALEASTVDSGCLWVVPGSHVLGAKPLSPRSDPPNVFGWESPPELVDESAAVPVELAAGDVSLHHPALVHRSGPNRTARRRAALAVRYRRA
jgi:phytanoyl-CoA hydroxylase